MGIGSPHIMVPLELGAIAEHDRRGVILRREGRESKWEVVEREKVGSGKDRGGRKGDC